MKNLVLFIAILCLFAFQSCNETQEREVFTYELVYKIHYPSEVVTETYRFHSYYNSNECSLPKYQLTTNSRGTSNYLYVFGNRDIIGSDLLISTTAPLQVVSLRKIN